MDAVQQEVTDIFIRTKALLQGHFVLAAYPVLGSRHGALLLHFQMGLFRRCALFFGNQTRLFGGFASFCFDEFALGSDSPFGLLFMVIVATGATEQQNEYDKPGCTPGRG